MNDDLYEHNPWDPTTNAGLLIPAMVYIQLKCKVFDPTAVTTGRHRIHNYRMIPYKVDMTPERYVFMPLREPEPPWRVVRGFIPGSFVLEAYTATGQSLVMWDVGGQEHYRVGDRITPDICTMSR